MLNKVAVQKKKGVDVKRFRVFFIFMVLLWSSQSLIADVGEPKPVFRQPFVSVFEQQVLLKAVQGEKPDALSLLLADAPGMDSEKEEAVRRQLSSFLNKFQKKQQRYSDRALLEQLYYATHRKFLKDYQPYRNFYSLVNEGSYNCLSATALYAYFLEELGYEYQVYETDYHIFLLVRTSDGEEIMFESTDSLYGFVEGETQIAQRLKQIKQDVLPQNSGKNGRYYNFNLNVVRPVSLSQLAGLQYFNQAAAFYNAQRAKEAEILLSKGRLLYQAERFELFARLLADAK